MGNAKTSYAPFSRVISYAYRHKSFTFYTYASLSYLKPNTKSPMIYSSYNPSMVNFKTIEPYIKPNTNPPSILNPKLPIKIYKNPNNKYDLNIFIITVCSSGVLFVFVIIILYKVKNIFKRKELEPDFQFGITHAEDY